MKREATLKQLTALSEVCVQLSAAMLTFEDVVVRENSALKRSDIRELEAITDEKSLFGEKLKSQVRRLAERMDDFVSSMGLKRISNDEERQLTEFVKAVRKALQEAGEDAELMDALSRFEGKADELKATREKIFAQVEINAYLVNRLLDFHRQNLRFWAQVANDSEATYGAKGKAKPQQNAGQRSILTVRT